MAGGVSIGSAYFTLDASSAGLIQSLNQAEQASKKSVAAISQTTGIAERDVQRLAQTWVRSEKSRADASAQATLKMIKAHNDVAAATQKSTAVVASAGSGFASAAQGALGFAAAAGGVALGAVAIHQAISKVTEVTQQANQAQFALNATYKNSAPTYTEFAAQQATATKRTTAEVQQAITAFGSLSNRYALTSDQVKELTKRSADLAAVHGITTVEAAKRLEAALRGEAESAEFLGLTLNSDYLKKFADMTAEQRKNFDTLDPLVKTQIIYREALKQTNDVQGQAAKRSLDAAGASDRFKTALDNLALTVGRNVTPTVQTSTGALAAWIEKVEAFLRKNRELQQAQGISTETAISVGAGPDARRPRPGSLDPESDPEAQAQARRAAAAQGAVFDDIRKRQEQAAAARRDAIKAELEAADKANDKTAESAIAAIDKERKAKERWYDEEKQRIEARRTYQLEDIETRKDAAIKALEDEKQAAKDRFDEQIKDAEREKQLRLRTAEEARDQALAAIETQKQANDRTREIEDREREDSRRRGDQRIEDARRYEDQQRDAAQERELKRLDDLKDARLKAIDDEIKAEEARTQRALRNIDKQIEKAREKSQKAVRGIDEEATAEDDRHRKAMQALDDEQDARLAILDAQLKALDAADKAEDSARRMADLQRRVAEAQQAVTAARGTGTPEQIAQAREELTRAIRVGNEVSEQNARDRLVKLAGQGNTAIQKADEDLAKAQDDLRKEGVDEQRAAERDKLKAAQDAIKDEIDARKRAEDERDRQRKDELDKDKQAESDKLDDTLKKLEKRKQARQDASKEELDDIKMRREAVQKEADDAISAARSTFDEQTQRIQARRREEDRDREDRQREEDRQRADERHAEDDALEAQKNAIARAFEDERNEAEEHYNGPNGVITKLKKASEDTEREYSRQLAAVRIAFEEERKAAERIYTNPEGNGLLQLLDKARADEIQKLDQSKLDWQQWQKDVSQAIKDAMADLDTFIQRGANTPRIGGDNPAQRSPGSGKLTSSSEQETRSGYSGKRYQGDWVSWLNDAMDITGIGNDWFNGLQRLASLENGGHDPDLPNRQGSGATGLLQVKPDTFKSFRDKDLPNNIHDPVANLVAGINWIKYKYKHVNNIPGLYGGGFEGYARGGWITEPIVGTGLRSGTAYSFGEVGPEYVSPSSRYGSSASLLGPAPLPNYAAMGATMAAIHPSANGSSYQDNSTTHIHGAGTEELMRKIRRDDHKKQLLRGVRSRLR